ncbi:MAG: hypothetical protein QW041_00900 [Candidatus Pacearchaeota archaeon]
MDNEENFSNLDKEKKPFDLNSFYDKNYKILLIIPILMLILSLIYIVSFTIQTGDFVRKDVSLTGGTTLTIYNESLSIEELKNALQKKLSDISIRKLTDFSTGKQLALTIESKAQPEELKKIVESIIGYELNDSNSSIEFTGESLSKSFYKELLKAMFLAFIFMSLTIFLIFGTNTKFKTISVLIVLIIFILQVFINIGMITDILSIVLIIILILIYIKFSIPSVYVITCAIADILIPMSVVNLIGIHLSTAGIAAFLMLIGYSVDSDIVLTMRVLKRKEDTLNNKIFGAFKTGLTMTLTSLVAVFVGYIITISPVLKQIFFILLIGLITDILMTWLMNASLLKWYCEKGGIAQ